MLKKHLEYFFNNLKKMFPNAETELNYETPFQLLIAVMLSAQATDKQVNKVTKKLFEIVKTPQDIINMGQDELTKDISSINYYRNKAKHIFQTSQMLSENKSSGVIPAKAGIQSKKYKIPNTLSDLIRLPGVGEKTAKVVLHVLYGAKIIAVDTHVFRVVNRIGLVNTRTPLQTSKILEKKIPEKFKSIAHHCLILFGRYHCKSRNPDCKDCPFNGFCKYKKEL